MELTGLKLRKAACEALGWSCILNSVGWYWICKGNPSCELMGWDREDAAWGHAPAIESDPAVSEPMFLEWLEKHGYQGKIVYSPSIGMFDCYVVAPKHEVAKALDCATPSEARCRAIVEATHASPSLA